MNVITPTPPHPTPTWNILLRSIKHVCKCKWTSSYPPHPTPTWNILLRSIKHVCKCKWTSSHPPHPTPPPHETSCCVASNMCASAHERHHTHPTPPHPTPTWNILLRSIKHVCKCKWTSSYPSHPTPPPHARNRAHSEWNGHKHLIYIGEYVWKNARGRGVGRNNKYVPTTWVNFLIIWVVKEQLSWKHWLPWIKCFAKLRFLSGNQGSDG